VSDGRALAVVFLDGEYEDAGYYRRWALAADLMVAADGGGRFLAAAGLVPHMLVGDFDSLDEAAVDEARRRGARLVRHPVHKDKTDGELAVDEALRAGAGEVVLAGALGALDHVLGHLALLGRVESGGTPARLVSPSSTVRVLVAPAGVRLDAGPGTRVSLAPLAGDAVVTLAGMDYPLTRGLLPGDACLGLGNAVSAAATGATRAPVRAAIEVHAGRVAVLVARGMESFGGLRLPSLPGAEA
jgi:thiamine pyrophosphokinase